MPDTHIDQPFITWARKRGLCYYYTSEYGLPENCLKLHLGVVTAYVHNGKLLRLHASGEGTLIDEMMCELSQLFAICTQHDAYMDQAVCNVPTTVVEGTSNRRFTPD